MSELPECWRDVGEPPAAGAGGLSAGRVDGDRLIADLDAKTWIRCSVTVADLIDHDVATRRD